MIFTSQCSHSQHLFTHSPSTCSSLCFTTNCSLSLTNLPTHFRIPNLNSFGLQKFSSFETRPDPFHLKAYESEGAVLKRVVGDSTFNSLLSLLELSFLLSSAIVLIGFALNGVIAGSKNGFLVAICNNRVVVVCGILMLVGGVAFGVWIRRRQWRRICVERMKGGLLEVNLVERIEKLEEDLGSSVTVIRVLSRQIEKLGTRFQITRQILKDPITETAALAQKNSEATRALALQSDILEKELGEIQKVFLAMQICGMLLDESQVKSIVDEIKQVITASSSRKSERAERAKAEDFDAEEVELIKEENEEEEEVFDQVGEILGTLIKTFKASFLPFFDELSSYLTPMWVLNKIYCGPSATRKGLKNLVAIMQCSSSLNSG